VKALAEFLFNQDFFAAVVALAVVAAIYRPDSKSWAVFLWAIVFFATDIPNRFGWEFAFMDKYHVHSLLSVTLILFYLTITRTKYTAMSAIFETLITLVNGIWVSFVIPAVPSEWHQWYWWLAIVILNACSLACIIWNKWGEEYVRRARESYNRLAYSLGNVRYLHGIIRKTYPGKGGCKKSG
jgi:hypothetical protein